MKIKFQDSKVKLVEKYVSNPTVNQEYWFTKNDIVYHGKLNKITNAWYMFTTDEGRNIDIPKWANIATEREDLEAVISVVNKMEKDVHIPNKVTVPNRFTRQPIGGDANILFSVSEGYELLSGTKVEVYSDYHKALKRANKLGLKEAEYGDLYNSEISYCYWNKSGDRNEDEEVMAYYAFDGDKLRALTKDERSYIEKEKELTFNDSIKEAFDGEEPPFTKKQVRDELKRETNNWETNEATIRYFYAEERDFAMEVLSLHYECEYLGRDEDGWYMIHFWKEDIQESLTEDVQEVTCKYCDNKYPMNNLPVNKYGAIRCKTCGEPLPVESDKTIKCSVCDNVYVRAMLKEKNGKLLCPTCGENLITKADDTYKKCDHCGGHFNVKTYDKCPTCGGDPIMENLTEGKWDKKISVKLAVDFRKAIEADEPNYEELKALMKDIYGEFKNMDIIDEDDYEDACDDIDFLSVDASDFDGDEEALFDEWNYEIGKIWDICDDCNVWMPLEGEAANEAVEPTKKKVITEDWEDECPNGVKLLDMVRQKLISAQSLAEDIIHYLGTNEKIGDFLRQSEYITETDYGCDLCGSRVPDNRIHWINGADIGLCDDCYDGLSYEQLERLEDGDYSLLDAVNEDKISDKKDLEYDEFIDSTDPLKESAVKATPDVRMKESDVISQDEATGNIKISKDLIDTNWFMVDDYIQIQFIDANESDDIHQYIIVNFEDDTVELEYVVTLTDGYYDEGDDYADGSIDDVMESLDASLDKNPTVKLFAQQIYDALLQREINADVLLAKDGFSIEIITSADYNIVDQVVTEVVAVNGLEPEIETTASGHSYKFKKKETLEEA